MPLLRRADSGQHSRPGPPELTGRNWRSRPSGGHRVPRHGLPLLSVTSTRLPPPMPSQRATLSNLASFWAQPPLTEQIPPFPCFRARQIVARRRLTPAPGERRSLLAPQRSIDAGCVMDQLPPVRSTRTPRYTVSVGRSVKEKSTLR